MRIDELKLVVDGGWQTLSARVEWENVARPAQTIQFRTPDSSLQMATQVNSFVIAAAVPAMAAGETRITSDFPLNPVLSEGLPSALAIVHYWCQDISLGWRIPEIDAPVLAHPTYRGRSTASFFSGGIDSTFTLLHNHKHIPVGVQGRITEALLVYGLDLGFRADVNEWSTFDEFVAQVSPFLHARGVHPVCVESNLRQLDSRSGFWGRAFNGFALSAIAHLFPDHIEQVLIGTNGDRLNNSVQHPWGSHPVLHNYLNTNAVQLRSPYVEFSRLKRVSIVARDSAARANLRVCFRSQSGELNCGKCEKCVRTRLALLLCGSDPSLGFAGPPMSPALVDSIEISSRLGQDDHEELRNALHDQGFHDLASAESALLERWLRYEYWQKGMGWKGWLRRKRDAFLAAAQRS